VSKGRIIGFLPFGASANPPATATRSQAHAVLG